MRVGPSPFSLYLLLHLVPMTSKYYTGKIRVYVGIVDYPEANTPPPQLSLAQSLVPPLL